MYFNYNDDSQKKITDTLMDKMDRQMMSFRFFNRTESRALKMI